MCTLTICNSPLGPLRFKTATRPGTSSRNSEKGKSLSNSVATKMRRPPALAREQKEPKTE
eukprot:2798486-Pyramimonas_sp.AAC.1